MLIDQAVFTSINANQLQGYQLVGRSDGIDDRLAQSLCRWSPSHGGMVDDHEGAESINFFSMSGDRFVLSRSIYGGPEYSRRAGQKVYTRILVFSRQQLAAFDNDCMAMSRIAQSSGMLTLDSNTPQNLPKLELPDRPFLPQQKSDKLSSIEGRIANLVENELPVAVIGIQNPARFVKKFVPKLPIEMRARMSFCTGLKLTDQRPFAVQFFPENSAKLKSQLTRLRISTVLNSP